MFIHNFSLLDWPEASHGLDYIRILRAVLCCSLKFSNNAIFNHNRSERVSKIVVASYFLNYFESFQAVVIESKQVIFYLCFCVCFEINSTKIIYFVTRDSFDFVLSPDKINSSNQKWRANCFRQCSAATVKPKTMFRSMQFFYNRTRLKLWNIDCVILIKIIYCVVDNFNNQYCLFNLDLG